MKKINYYESFEDDFVQSEDQNYKLPDDYRWIHSNIFYKICSSLIYEVAYFISLIYCRFFLHIRIKNRKILKKYKNQGYFIYGNHTQPIGDVFTPAHCCKGKRTYVIASSSNLKVKVIGGILPILGILPIPDSANKMKDFIKAVKKRVDGKNAVVIYPEAHVWPYYTKIREFGNTSFKFPVECNVPAFCMTTTYYKRKFSKKPGIKVYIDGPFFSNEQLNKKQRQEELKNKIYNCMLERSTNSNYEYVKYVKIEQD